MFDFNCCVHRRVDRNYLTLSYLIDRLLLLSRDLDLAAIPWISPHDNKLQFLNNHVKNIELDELYILGISNCEVLLFLIRKWQVTSFFTQNEIFSLYKHSKKQSFEISFGHFVADLPKKDALFLLLALRLIKKVDQSDYQSDLYHILIPPFTTGEIIDKMLDNISVIERKLYPSKFTDDVPKLLINNKSLKFSNLEINPGKMD